jgi:hypothetical protein
MTTEVPCSAGCKRVALLPDDGSPPPGWDCLQITGRYRCPQCGHELNRANTMLGTPSAFSPDPLPPGSIGALKKLPEPPPLREEVKT